DIALLRQVHPSLPAMKVNAALACILAGAALAVRHRAQLRRGLARGPSAGVSLIRAPPLFQALPRRDRALDQLLFPDEADPTMPGRMSPATAFNFLLIGLALALLDARVRPAQWMALGAGLLSLLALLGNIYGVRSMFDVGEYEAMALHPAVTLVLCCGS